MHGYYIVDDYLLAWFHENLIGECGKKSSVLEKGGNYSGLWKFKNILCLGVLSDLANKATRLPHGWVWIVIPNKPNMRILKFLYTDENFYKIDKNYTSKDITYVFYNDRNQKICEIKEAEKREPYRKVVAKALGLKANDRNVNKIINRTIRKAKSKKTFAKIPADTLGLGTKKMEVQKKTSGINFIRKTKTTEEFWNVYLKKEGIPNKVFDIEGYRLFCTGFPRPFIPHIIDNNSWVRVFDSIPHRYDTQIYDLWILQSDLKEFYKYIINSGKGIALVECLGLKVDNTPERVRASNIIQRFYKKRRKKKFDYPRYIKRTTSIENPEEDYGEEESESEDDWEKNLDDINERIDKEIEDFNENNKEKEQSHEERMLQIAIENTIANDDEIIELKKDLQRTTSLHNSVSNRVNLINKYIIEWKRRNRLSGNEKRYYHIWWFLCFGKKFFRHYKGDIIYRRGKKVYLKDTSKYLAEGDMIFIFREFKECINHFQSLVNNINSTLRIWKNSKTTEKIGYTNLTRKQKKRAVKTGLVNTQDGEKELYKDYAYDDLENLMNDSVHLELYFSIGGGGSYADALSLLKNLPDIKKCCIKIVKGLQNIVKEKERKIKDYLKDINELNNLITIRKEIIRNSYK